MNVIYDVYVNGVVKTLTTDSFGVLESCTYKQLDLGSAVTNINVTVVVIGIPRSGRRQLDDSWSFQLNEVLAMTSATSPNSSTASAPGMKASWFQGLAAMLLTGFGLAL